MRFIDTRAITLGRRTLSGADRLLTVLTPEHGRLMVVVPGLARARAPLYGALAPFTVWRIILGGGRGGLMRVESAEAVARLPRLNDSLGPMRAAGMVCAWVRATSREAPGDPQGRDRFALLTTTLRAMTQQPDPAPAAARFLWRWTHLAGIGPQVNGCIDCGRPPGQGGFLRLNPGGRICNGCRKAGDLALSRRDGTDLDAGLSACNTPQNSPWRQQSVPVARGLASLAQTYLRHHFGAHLP